MKNIKTSADLGLRLKAAREINGVTQKDMAAACNVSKNHISAIERGVNTCSATILLNYADYLNITLDALLRDPQDQREIKSCMICGRINNDEKWYRHYGMMICNTCSYKMSRYYTGLNKNTCAICCLPKTETRKLYVFDGLQSLPICSDCCTRAMRSFYADRSQISGKEKNKTCVPKTPQEIKQHLDKYVIKQDKAKKNLAVAAYQHIMRTIDSEYTTTKNNIMLIGPSGCGKTLLIKTLANILDIPFAMIDATSLTAAGYRGKDVESIVMHLLSAAGGDISAAERGIVFIDEIDKIAALVSDVNKDIGGESVQQELLKLIEGTKVSINNIKSIQTSEDRSPTVDTSNILFVAAGAFVGRDRIAKKNAERKCIEKYGYPSEWGIQEFFKENRTITEDLIDFGMIPELIGRFPILIDLEELTVDDLIRVLTDTSGSLTEQYKHILKKEGVDLVFEDDAIREIAKKSIERHTGARGLKSILEELMLDIMFEVPSDTSICECRITRETVIGGPPVIIRKSEH